MGMYDNLKNTLFVILIGLSCSFICLKSKGYEQYQDIIINGRVVEKANYGHFDCESRFKIIKTVFEKYQRPFTMLDLGAAQGYYSLKSAWFYPDSVFVMIEGNNSVYPLIGDQLHSICEENYELSNIVLLKKKIFLKDLQKLATCEHFDIVLALNIIHWFPNEWKKICDAIIELGSDIIIETPPYEEEKKTYTYQLKKDIIEYLQTKNPTVLGTVPRHRRKDLKSSIFLIKGKRNYLKHKSWISPINVQKTHKIISSYTKKQLTKKIDFIDLYQTVNWEPGINLWTFIMMSGSYPYRSCLMNELFLTRNLGHNDWYINNMIVQGNRLKLIDWNDPNHDKGARGGCVPFTMENYRFFKKLLGLENPDKALQFYYEYRGESQKTKK